MGDFENVINKHTIYRGPYFSYFPEDPKGLWTRFSGHGFENRGTKKVIRVPQKWPEIGTTEGSEMASDMSKGHT